MLRLYLNILVLGVGAASFAVLAVAAVQGHTVTRQDFIFPVAIQVLLTSLVFLLRELVRRYDARVAARAISRGAAAQMADFKAALRHHRQEFSKGFRTWNS